MTTRDDDERRPSPFSIPLSSFHILDAINRSPDGGVTLLLSKLNISSIGPAEASQLSNLENHEGHGSASIVERLTLGSNQLTTLPDEFAHFSRLRYLNLKHNSFSTFPDVLTLMPLLDTLDISHNKIKALPSRPGQLIHLRVLCLSRNKLRRLPVYLTQFRMLDVLQIERNPLEWPPKSEVDYCGVLDVTKGKEWIRNLQNWIEINSSTSQEYDDSGYSEQPRWGNNLYARTFPRASECNEPSARSHAYNEWQLPIHQSEFDAGVTPHARSLSVDSDASMLSITESSPKTGVNGCNTSDQPPWVRHLSDTHIACIEANRGRRRDTDGLELASPTSLSANSSFEALPDVEQMHLRTASYASTLSKPQPKFMIEKKSLPDLRMVQSAPTKSVPNPSEGPMTPHDEGRSFEESSTFSPFRHDFNSSGSASVHPENIQASNALPSLDYTSYFQRSSTLTFNNSLPKSLLCLLESARNILFAMSKLYQTLEHHAHHGPVDRLPSIFKKSLDPANLNISHLIRSLDRFDDCSQKARPSPSVCRALVESCRDVVIMMKKAAGLLTLQIGLEPFNGRYSRWLILELYAITVEIALAWHAVVPYVNSLRPFLYGGVFTHSYVSNVDTLAGPISLLGSDQRSTPGVRLRSAEALHGDSGTTGTGGVRMTRRHAGSFSSKDVQIGKELPSYDIIPTMMGRLTTQTPTLRTPKRQATMPVFPTLTSTSAIPSYTLNQVYASHLRHSSQSSLVETSSLISSAPESFSNIVGADKEAIQAVRDALEIAPVVWGQIEEVLSDILTLNKDTQQVLEKARLVTRKLSDDVHATSEDDPENFKKAVGHSAHLFLKALVQVSNILKSCGDSVPISAALRSNVVKLTNLTEEFAILLHVSSISTFTPHSNSPTLKFSATNPSLYLPEDNQLSSNLSRARNGHPVRSSPPHPSHGTHPSIPTAAAKSTSARRLRHTRETLNDSIETDPG